MWKSLIFTQKKNQAGVQNKARYAVTRREREYIVENYTNLKISCLYIVQVEDSK